MRLQAHGFKELESALGASSQYLTTAFANISAAFTQVADEVIADTLIQAAAQAGPEAFPAAYVPPMIEAARSMVIVLPGEVSLDFDELGNSDELSEGFHYKARIDQESHVELPYQGEDLKNDVTRRYEFWLKVLHGESYNNFDYAGAWDETIAARLSVWGNKAPQWLLLEYGQEEWEPTIQPYPIVESITAELYGIFYSMLEDAVQELVKGLNRPIPVVPAPPIRTFNRDAKGRFARVED